MLKKIKNVFFLIAGIIGAYILVNLLFSTPIGILGVIKYFIFEILIFFLWMMFIVMYFVDCLKKNKKFEVKDIFLNIIILLLGLVSIYIGGKSAINLGADLIQRNIKVETFNDFSVSIEGSRSPRYILNVESDDGEVLEFKINTDTYMKADEYEYVTVTYYENTKIVMDIEYAGAK